MIIESVKKSESGKSLTVYADGKKYQTKEWYLEHAQPGSTLEGYSIGSSAYEGKTFYWLNTAEKGTPITVHPPAAGTPQKHGILGPKQAPSDKDFHIFVCGVVNNICASGKVESPGELIGWVRGARDAWKALDEPASTTTETTGPYDGDPVPF